jgi:hypothetical protein
MTRIRRHITVALIALAALGLAAPAAHADYRAAIRDCADDGVLQGSYTRQELRQALSHLPADLREYSDCTQVLNRALASLANKNNGSRSVGTLPAAAGNPALTTPSGAVATTPQQLASLKQQTGHAGDNSRPAPTVAVAGRQVTPGLGGLFNAAARTSPNQLPVSLLLALVALALMGAIAGLLVLRHRWPETRRAALRILRR